MAKQAYVYSGTDWVPLASEVTNLSNYQLSNGVGLNKVIPTSVSVGSGSGSVDANGAVTFSGVSSLSLNGCFSSTYENYRIVVNLTSTDNNEFRWRGRTSGSDNTNANYVFQILEAYVSSVGASRTSGATYGYAGYLDASGTASYILDFFSPQTTRATGMSSTVLRNYAASSPVIMFINNGFTSTTSFDSVTLYPGSGTITGTVRVYGYKN